MDPLGYGSVMANFLRQAMAGEAVTVYGDGLQRRCLTYVDDCIDGTVMAMETGSAEAQVFNIGDSKSETTILDLARLVIEVTGSASEISHVSYERRFGPGFEDTRRRVPDTDRARERLGWTSQVGLGEGLRQTLASLTCKRPDDVGGGQ
jgi:UDP-glucose 4-epimerase